MKKSKTKITPRGSYILVKPDEAESRESEHGIVSPENQERERKAIGTVMSVGSEINDMKKGQRVIYGVYAGEEITFKESLKEVDYKLLHEEDILAFIE